MPVSKEIVVWYLDRKYDALRRELERMGTGFDPVLQTALDDLYKKYVPEQEQKAIAAAMQEDADREAREEAWHREQNYRVSAVRIIYMGGRWEWKILGAVDVLHLARCLRTALQQPESKTADTFLVRLGEKEPISSEEFEGFVSAKLHGDIHVEAVCSLDFRRQMMTMAVPGKGWLSYRMKDVSTAIYHADRKKHITVRVAYARFTSALQGKSIDLQPDADPPQ